MNKMLLGACLMTAAIVGVSGAAMAEQSGFGWCLDYWESKGYNLTAATNYCTNMSEPGLICTFGFGERGESIYVVERTCSQVHNYGAAECMAATAERYSSVFAGACVTSEDKGFCMAELIRRGQAPQGASLRCRF